MDVTSPEKGKYIVAVSGGVDSVSLLHFLKDKPGVDIVVAHFDHGIREDSQDDREFVQELAEKYGLPFLYEEGWLGAGTGEAAARDARYGFLRRVMKDEGGTAIITAHHRDDVLETAVINLLRGGGRKGLTSLASRGDVVRPLLEVPKDDIIAYAKDQGLKWREDITNQDTDYLRNYVRHRLLPRFDAAGRDRLWSIITGLRTTNKELDQLLSHQLAEQSDSGRLDRGWFITLPHGVAKETMAAWLRDNGIRDFNAQTIERLVIAAKTAGRGKKFDVTGGAALAVNASDLALETAE